VRGGYVRVSLSKEVRWRGRKEFGRVIESVLNECGEEFDFLFSGGDAADWIPSSFLTLV
jgi:hypothetical protein